MVAPLPKNKIIVGTRGSVLAVSQTKLVMQMLQQANPGLEYEIKTIKTSGDEGKDILGAFVKEVEVALINKDIDLAIHSLKDMPTQLPAGVCIGAMPQRGAFQDCLVSRNNIKLDQLPHGAKVGTSSLRRAYQLKAVRPDLEIVALHGNIISRMQKVEDGILDAVILATAGIERISMQHKISQVFTEKEMLPAVSQGILALEVRTDDNDMLEIIEKITDRDTEDAADAERSFLAALGGGCRMPIGGYAKTDCNQLVLKGIMYNEDGSRSEYAQLAGPSGTGKELGTRLGELLLARFKEDVR